MKTICQFEAGFWWSNVKKKRRENCVPCTLNLSLDFQTDIIFIVYRGRFVLPIFMESEN